jgi:hypothetical protein
MRKPKRLIKGNRRENRIRGDWLIENVGKDR